MLKVLIKKFKKLPKRRQIEAGLIIFLVLVALGFLIWALITGKLKSKAAGPQISNTATATYQDNLGHNNTVQSNTVLVDLVSGAGEAVFNLNMVLQGRTNFTATNITLNIYPVGQTTAIATETGASSNTVGLVSFTLNNITPGTYDLVLRAPNFLSVKKANVTLTNSNTVDFGTLLAGDINNDNMVNILDYSLMISSWRKQSGDTGYNANADLKQDNQINILDYSLLISNWRKQGS